LQSFVLSNLQGMLSFFDKLIYCFYLLGPFLHH
jgi:hypothetical protein